MITIRYAVSYARNFRHLKEVDEILLTYNGSGNLVEFINDTFNKRQRIIIDVAGTTTLEQLLPTARKLIKDDWNIAIRTDFNQENINILKDIPFFFNKFPKNKEEVYIQAIAGASDIYITEALGFDLKALQRIKEQFKVQFRVFPNIAQTALGGGQRIPAMQQFWIRPEDTELYEDYIDIFEILGGEDQSRLSVVYEIYKQRQWLGNLNDLILDFGDIEVNNRGINPRFGLMRLDCNKLCLEGKCHLCTEMATLADLFTEVGIEVIKKKYKPERTEEEKQVILNRLRSAEDGFKANEETLPSK